MLKLGIVRKMDSLGRVVIPKEYRKLYNIEKNGGIVLVAQEDGILITNPNYKLVKID